MTAVPDSPILETAILAWLDLPTLGTTGTVTDYNNHKEVLPCTVTFYGAVREVTGSMHMVATETDRILLDCGMFQGRRREAEEKNRVLPFDPA